MTQWIRRGLLFSLVYHVILAILVIFFLGNNQNLTSLTKLRSVWNAWDGNTYIFLATHGYVTKGDESNYIVFYPVYPLLVSAISTLGVQPHVAGVVVSMIGSVVGHTFFFVIFRQYGFSEKKSRQILLLFFVNPVTIYFMMVCTEGVFLAFTTLFFFFLLRKQFILAVLLASLASATRHVGVILLIPYLCWFYEHWEVKKERKYILLFPIIPLGFVIFLLINWYYFHDFFYYQKILEANWHKSIVNPIPQYLRLFFSFIRNLLTGQLHFFTHAMDVFSTLAFPFLLIAYLLKKGKTVWWSWTLWALSNWLIIASQSFWLSNMRYMALILPVYVMIVDLIGHSKILYFILFLTSTAIALYGIHLFTQGGWLY